MLPSCQDVSLRALDEGIGEPAQPPILPLASRLLSAWNCVLCLMLDGWLVSGRAGGTGEQVPGGLGKGK